MEVCARVWRGLPLLAAVSLLPLVELSGDRYRYTVGFTVEAL
jgi:hypothetical protein